MDKSQLIEYWKEQGEKWLNGKFKIEGWELGGNPIKLTDKQAFFLYNFLYRGCLGAGLWEDNYPERRHAEAIVKKLREVV